MTVTRILCALILLAQTVSAQSTRGGQPKTVKKDAAMEEASRVLSRAKTDGQKDAARRALEQAGDSRRAEGLLAQAANGSGRTTSAAEKSREAASDAKLSQALKDVSTPEGKALLAQNNPSKAPGAGQVIPVAKVIPADNEPPAVVDAKPQPMKPTPLNPPAKKEPARTVITSQGAAFFDSKQAMGVFTDDVIVNHPQFHLTCDVLEVYMIKQAVSDEKEEPDTAAGGKKPAVPDAPPVRPAGVLPGEAAPAGPDNNIRQAIAKGPKVIIQKVSENGEPQIGICRHATYVGASGDIIMRDYPQVQRGNKLVVATDPSTVMTILQNGQFKSQGPTRTDIIQDNQKNIAPAPKPPVNPNAALAPAVQNKTRVSQ